MKAILRQLLELIFPPRCCACGKACRFSLCGKCSKMLIPLNGRLCEVCGAQLADGDIWETCEECEREAPKFIKARSAYIYEGVCRKAIHNFKFNGRKRIRDRFADVLIERMNEWGISFDEFDVIVPVPLPASRLKERGYNQSELIAQSISEIALLPVNCSMLSKIRNVRPQSELDRRQRVTNLKGVFQARGVDGKKILLIDDIYTTGATAREASSALVSAGAASVTVLTVARAVQQKRDG